MTFSCHQRAVRLSPGADSLTQSLLCLAKSNRWDGAHDALQRLCDADPEMSWSTLESLVRYYHCGSTADEYVTIARKVWDEASSEANSP